MSRLKDPQQGETVEGGDTEGDAHSDPRPAPVATGQRFERDGGNGQDVVGVPPEVEPAPEGAERGAALRSAPSPAAAASRPADGTVSGASSPPELALADDQRAAWLAWRRDGLGGSDVAALLNLSPWQSPWSIWLDKVGVHSVDRADEMTEAMEFGAMIEPILARYFHARTGLYVAGEQTWCSKPDAPWMRCTPDGFVCEAEAIGCDGDSFDLDAALGLAEWKSTSDAPAAWEAEIPVHYACQCQWSMAVTGFDRVWLGVLHLAFGRPSFRVYEVTRNDEDIALLTKVASEFWTQYVIPQTPPPTDGSEATTRALGEAWEPTDAAVEADDRVLVHVAEHRRLSAELKRLESARDAHANAIRAALGEATVLTHGVTEKGKPIVAATWRPSPRTGFDHKALLAHEDDDGWWRLFLARFKTNTTTRQLLVKPTKGD